MATSCKRFRIAFSFAGERRDYVEQVARILADRFSQAEILYDKFHEAEFARYDLGTYLPKLYREQSELVVAVFSPEYDKKRWTGWEWMAIHAQLTKHEGSEVMLTRFDHANPDGLFENAAFVELDGKAATEFAKLILERLALNEALPKDHYTRELRASQQVSALKTAIPHNLPTLQPFFGREDELRRIADALDPDSRTWGALIDGPGGMGKTSLAVRAAYDASSEVFKKIIFISLKARELDDDGVRALSGFILSGVVELLNELGRELDCDDIAKAPEDQRPRLLLNALRGTQTLLVLDNIESLLKRERDTLFTFVKKLPVGCKAILTSRGRIGSGAEELILEKLSEEAALATLAELAAHNPHLAQTTAAERLVLYRETAGSPLLLRWTAGQLGRGHCLTFADALRFIRSCPDGNDPLEFVFGDLVEDFDAAETQALCALTYFTLPASVEHVATVAGLLQPDADRALRRLTVRSLAVPTDELKTFTLVPMVADFLRKRRPEVVAEAGDRLGKRAYALILECGYRNHARFPELEAAWPSIAPALAIFLVGDNKALQTVCDALSDFLAFSGRWDEWLSLFSRAEIIAVEKGDFGKAGSRAYQIAFVHYLRNQGREVLEWARITESHWQHSGLGIQERALVMRLRGWGNELSKNYPEAIVAFSEMLDLFRTRSKSSRDIVNGLADLATVEELCGNLDDAESHFTTALRVAEKQKYVEGIALIKGGLADVALRRQEWTKAFAFANDALALAEKVSHKDFAAENCHRVAKALVRQGRAAEALPHARLAVTIFTRLGSPDREAAQAILTECELALTAN